MEKHFFWWGEQTIYPKNIFLTQLEIVLNFFTIFVRSAPVEFPSKIQISKNCLKLWRNTSFDERNKQFIQKIFFFTQLEIVLNFHYFCKVWPVEFSVKNSNFQKLPKIVEKHFFWWKEQIILPKNIFLAQFEKVLNFHYFCKVRTCWISVEKKNFQKLP